MERLLHAQALGNKAMLGILAINNKVNDAINMGGSSVDATLQLADLRHLLLDLLSTVGDLGDLVCDNMDEVAETLSEVMGDDEDG